MADEQKNYEPESCPKCEGDMDQVGDKREWRCGTCGLIIKDSVPSWTEMEELIGEVVQAKPREYIGLDGPIIEKGGGSKSGKRHKKPVRRTSNLNPYGNNYLGV